MHYLALRAGIKISRFEKTSKLKEELQGFGSICGFEEQTQQKISFIFLFFCDTSEDLHLHLPLPFKPALDPGSRMV